MLHGVKCYFCFFGILASTINSTLCAHFAQQKAIALQRIQNLIDLKILQTLQTKEKTLYEGNL